MASAPRPDGAGGRFGASGREAAPCLASGTPVAAMGGNHKDIDAPRLTPQQWRRHLALARRRRADCVERYRTCWDRVAKAQRKLDDAVEDWARATEELEEADAELLGLVGGESSDPWPAAAAAPVSGPTFRKDGEKWTVSFEGKTVYMGHRSGMEYIACLLRHPGKEFHAAVLKALLAGARSPPPPGSAGDVVDQEALDDYGERIRELRDELAEAGADNDPAREERIQRELDMLTAQIIQATGLGGRKRKASDDAERARKAVSNAMTRAMDRIREEHPALWRHLDKAMSCGLFFSYSPGESIAWVT